MSVHSIPNFILNDKLNYYLIIVTIQYFIDTPLVGRFSDNMFKKVNKFIFKC